MRPYHATRLHLLHLYQMKETRNNTTNQLLFLGHVLALLNLNLEVLVYLSEVAFLQVSDCLLLLFGHHLQSV